MPRIKKEEVDKPLIIYTLNELLKVQQEIKKAGNEQQWLINKGAIYISKQPGYEGQIMVRANVDAQGNMYCQLSSLNEILRQLHSHEDEDGNITIYNKN
jgi:hypothetical protein